MVTLLRALENNVLLGLVGQPFLAQLTLPQRGCVGPALRDSRQAAGPDTNIVNCFEMLC